MSLANRLTNAWNAFLNRDPPLEYRSYGSSGSHPDTTVLSGGNDRTIITSLFNRIAVDAASIDIKHIRTDEDGRYLETIKDSGINKCLGVSANIDQSGRAFMIDLFLTLLDRGHAVILPTHTDVDPNIHDSFELKAIRVGIVKEWFPKTVRLEAYDESTGRKKEIVVMKKALAIIQNPFYATMNEQNSMMQRLSRKLALMDQIDAIQGSGKLDMIIQLPYGLKTDAQKKNAEERRKAIEDQLKSSTYGIAYIDATEKMTQINRPIENTLLNQVKYLTEIVYGQLGLTPEIVNGSANDEAMTNYYNRTIEPLLNAVVEEIRRKFLTDTARSQHQTVTYYRDPFKLVPISKLADLADKFTRNAILSSNEFRQIVGRAPSSDPNADVLQNKNLYAPEQSGYETNSAYDPAYGGYSTEEETQNAQ